MAQARAACLAPLCAATGGASRKKHVHGAAVRALITTGRGAAAFHAAARPSAAASRGSAAFHAAAIPRGGP